MKRTLLFASMAALLAGAAPASAQIGGILGKAQKAKETADKVKNAVAGMSEKDERQLGEEISGKLRGRFGVYQDAGVTKYVSLVGTVLAQGSTRPNLGWQFIVLDTEAVNAYAAPGGFVHVTRGLLGLMKNEAELADVLGHEITHVTEKHTVHAIQREKKITLATDEIKSGGDLRAQFLTRMANEAFDNVFDGKFSREDEADA